MYLLKARTGKCNPRFLMVAFMLTTYKTDKLTHIQILININHLNKAYQISWDSKQIKNVYHFDFFSFHIPCFGQLTESKQGLFLTHWTGTHNVSQACQSRAYSIVPLIQSSLGWQVVLKKICTSLSDISMEKFSKDFFSLVRNVFNISNIWF